MKFQIMSLVITVRVQVLVRIKRIKKLNLYVFIYFIFFIYYLILTYSFSLIYC